ncbi:GSCOCG00004651001-RA-CDS, partial [Cotesia congregata]
QLLELCFADQLNPIFISSELFELIHPTSIKAIEAPIVVIDTNLEFKNAIFLHNSYPKYLLVGDTTEKLESLLKKLKSFSSWSSKSETFIVDGTSEKSCLRQASQFLKLLWKMNLLSSFYMCLRSQNYTMVYTFNPFTNYAPHPWKEVEVTNKPDPRWTLYNLRFTQDNNICRLLRFDKSKLLNGYPVKISFHANIYLEFHLTVFNSLNLTSRLHHDLQFQKIRNFHNKFKTGKTDYTWNINPLKRIDNNIENAIPSYHIIEFAIATKSRYIISSFIQIDSVIDPYTGIFAISILLLIITLIGLVNEYQFPAAIVDVYRLLLLNMGIHSPIQKLVMRITFVLAFIFAFVFSPELQGKVFALLTKPSYRNIETLQDLYDYNYHVFYDTNVHDNMMNEGLWTTDDDQKYLHRIDNPYSLDCFELARHHSSVACISLSYYILKFASKYELYVSKDFIFPTYYVKFSRKDWALNDRVGQRVLHATEAGLIDYLKRKMVDNKLKRIKAIEKASELEKYDLIDETNLVAMYMFIATLFILAIGIFFFENMMSFY